MNFQEYHEAAAKTAVYPDKGRQTLVSVNYCVIGAAGEAGENLNKIKKVWRGDRSLAIAKPAMLEEIGDTLWYLDMLASEFGTTLEQIATENILKLRDRAARDVVKGDGDNR